MLKYDILASTYDLVTTITPSCLLVIRALKTRGRNLQMAKNNETCAVWKSPVGRKRQSVLDPVLNIYCNRSSSSLLVALNIQYSTPDSAVVLVLVTVYCISHFIWRILNTTDWADELDCGTCEMIYVCRIRSLLSADWLGCILAFNCSCPSKNSCQMIALWPAA